MKTIYLIRHSKAEKNINFYDIKNKQIENKLLPLSIEGEEKASIFCKKHFNKNINHLWSSTYNRAISTAKYISNLNNITLNISNLFDERKLGNPKEVTNKFWLTQLKDENAKTKEGESQKEVRERMLKGLEIVLSRTKEGETSAIVSHASAITFLLMNWCTLKKATLKDKKRWLTYNNKIIINNSFNMPDAFKLEFDKNNLIDIIHVD